MRRVFRSGGRHGVNHDWRFLTLELVHRAYPRTIGQSFLDRKHLSVIRGNDEDVLQRDRSLEAIRVDPASLVVDEVQDQGCHGVGLLLRGTLVAAVRDWRQAQPRT